MVNALHLPCQHYSGVLFCQQIKGNIVYPQNGTTYWLVQKVEFRRRNYIASAVKHSVTLILRWRNFQLSPSYVTFNHCVDIPFFSSKAPLNTTFDVSLACSFLTNTILNNTIFGDLIRNNVMSKYWAGGGIWCEM